MYFESVSLDAKIQIRVQPPDIDFCKKGGAKMRLNKIEFMAMNNPLRRLLQKHLEFRVFKGFLKKHGININSKIILDAGCGSGYSTELIMNEFKPARLLAFDFMTEMIDYLARQRRLDAEFFVGDVTNTGLPSEHVDVVFIFGILHHVPEWRKGLFEVARVLKPNGIFLVEEVEGPLAQLSDKFFGTEHPKEAFFTWEEFTEVYEVLALKFSTVKF
jgi:ubiquinone/menaquinone biosynthesis C-methylase UbiE